MATPQQEAAEAEQARDRLEQAAMALFIAAYLAQEDEEPSESDLIRLRRLLSETVGWVFRQMRRAGLANLELERDDDLVDMLIGDMSKQLKALRRWASAQPDRDPGELSLQRNAARALATTMFNSVSHAVGSSLPDGEDTPPMRKVWITRKDKKVRALHRRLHGRSKALDADFWRWPLTGQRLRYPGDPLAPLDATVNCRCVLVMSMMKPSDILAAFPPLPPEDDD